METGQYKFAIYYYYYYYYYYYFNPDLAFQSPAFQAIFFLSLLTDLECFYREGLLQAMHEEIYCPFKAGYPILTKHVLESTSLKQLIYQKNSQREIKSTSRRIID